jgi:hypothetical protein
MSMVPVASWIRVLQSSGRGNGSGPSASSSAAAAPAAVEVNIMAGTVGPGGRRSDQTWAQWKEDKRAERRRERQQVLCVSV